MIGSAAPAGLEQAQWPSGHSGSAPSRPPRALLSTITPIDGGVPQMTRAIAAFLRERGMAVTLAFYQPYSIEPTLSAPLYKLFTRRPQARETFMDEMPAQAIGAWLPELEFTHYYPTRHWRRIMEQADYHLSISGNCLAAAPYALTGRRFWSWVATPWDDDRRQRQAQLPWYRRWVDALVSRRACRRLERRIIEKGGIVALSHYTQRRLDSLGGGGASVCDVMPMFIDTDTFAARPRRNDIPTIGFVGRLDDPRKNVELLVETVAWCRDQGQRVRALLIGGELPEAARRLQIEYALTDITVMPGMDREELPHYLNQMDLFVIPSHQEGLCIAALEAVACGVPVISTRCGGAEDFVIDDETGLLVDGNAESVGGAVLGLLHDTERRRRYAAGARRLLDRDYSRQAMERTFWRTFEATFHTAG